MVNATYEMESKHGAKLAALESSFQAESNKLKDKLHAAELENAKYAAAMGAKAEMQLEVARLNQAHFESSNTASCFKGALLMQTSFGAGGMSSRQVMGADQGLMALLGCSQSAPGGLGSLLLTAPENRVMPELKGPANEASPMPPHVAHDVQELIMEVEQAIKSCVDNKKFDEAAALHKGIKAIKQTVEEIALLDANLTEYKAVNAFDKCVTTKRELDEAVTKLNQQKNAVRNTLTCL